MERVGEEEIREALKVVQDPDLGKNIVELGFVKNVKICDTSVSFDVELTTPACPVKKELEAEARRAVQAIPGIETVSINMTSKVTSTGKRDELLAGVKNIIAVGSGKGGVGKSTVAVNIAVALARDGARVGLFDLDVWGPNVPTMVGIKGQVGVVDGKMKPPTRYGVKVMSVGFFLKDGQAVNWRGPMVHHYIRQMSTDVLWGELDYLICDLPPGTGDVALSMCQLIPPTGAVIVTTPQDVALEDAAKAVSMFRTVRVPILGIVENMSFFECPHCEKRTDIFSSGGAVKAAETLEIPFLGDISLDVDVRIGGDSGEPIVVGQPDSAVAVRLGEIARNLAARVSVTNALLEEDSQLGTPVVWGKPE
jgi:ATP-binding protein involved in chromosome partitioning